MEDSIVVRFPSRAWALSAITDLHQEGCEAQLLSTPGACWSLRITGPADAIQVIRVETHAPSAHVCWESFVNEAVSA